MAEQLRLQEPLRHRRAVERDERPLAPRAALVQHACDDLLAHAALSAQENRHVALREQLDLLAQLHDRHRAPHQRRRAALSGQLRARLVPLARDRAALRQPVHDAFAEVEAIDRLDHIVERARAKRVHRLSELRRRREHHHRQPGRHAPQPLQHRERVDLRQQHVADHEIERLVRRQRERVHAIGGLAHVMALAAQELGQLRAVGGVLVREQDVKHASWNLRTTPERSKVRKCFRTARYRGSPASGNR